MSLRHLSVLVILLGFAAPALAWPWICEGPRTSFQELSAASKMQSVAEPEACPTDTYTLKSICFCTDPSCDRSPSFSIQSQCVDYFQPPADATLDCHRDRGTLNCEVWPQGAGLTYSWQASSGLSLLESGLTDSPLQSIDCAAKSADEVATVTVTSKYKLSSTTSLKVSCRGARAK